MAKRKRTIINLTTHRATPDQKAAGVVDLDERGRKELCRLLEFEELPTPQVIRDRAWAIAQLAAGKAEEFDFCGAMIGGAPWLMRPLAADLWPHGIMPVYAFSRRESEETVQPDGSVKKVAVFRHVGFVPA